MGVATTISSFLVASVREHNARSLDALVGGNAARREINCCCASQAAPAIINAVTAPEALVNEMALNPATKMVLRDARFWKVQDGWFDKLDLLKKIQLMVVLLFDSEIDAGHQPLQDLALLIKIRNDLVHYKMSFESPRYVKDLERRGLTMTTGDPQSDYAWVHQVCSAEVIRWAHNTMCRTALAMLDMVPDKLSSVLNAHRLNFVEIDEQPARAALAEAGLT